MAKEPDSVLEDALRAMRSGGAASGYGREIQRVISERLGAEALAKNDSDLARWLVSGESTAPLLGQDEGALGELATTKRGLANIDGRTIGLVLPTGSTDLRDEAAAIMLGVAWALDLPRADPSKGDRTKLATRDDGGDANRVEPSMAELAGEGAAVILAALDPVSADRAVRWGEEHAVAVIALAEPRPNALAGTDGGARAAVAHDWAFVAGVPRADEIAVLGEELVSRGLRKIVPIVPPSGSEAVRALSLGTVVLEPEVACDTAAAQSGEAHFPVEDWKKESVRAWLVDAPSECARDLVRELATAGMDGTMGLTLDAAGTKRARPGRGRPVEEIAVRAGAIPVTEASASAVADPDIKTWYARQGAPPSWWAALGHDAAVLARRRRLRAPARRHDRPCRGHPPPRDRQAGARLSPSAPLDDRGARIRFRPQSSARPQGRRAGAGEVNAPEGALGVEQVCVVGLRGRPGERVKLPPPEASAARPKPAARPKLPPPARSFPPRARSFRRAPEACRAPEASAARPVSAARPSFRRALRFRRAPEVSPPRARSFRRAPGVSAARPRLPPPARSFRRPPEASAAHPKLPPPERSFPPPREVSPPERSFPPNGPSQRPCRRFSGIDPRGRGCRPRRPAPWVPRYGRSCLVDRAQAVARMRRAGRPPGPFRRVFPSVPRFLRGLSHEILQHPFLRFGGRMSTDVMIDPTDLSKNFGSFRAVDKINFEVRRGEVVGFLGPKRP